MFRNAAEPRVLGLPTEDARRHAPEALAARLAPHLHVRCPPGEGPFPTVVCFHGCTGVNLGDLDWLDHLAAHGFAAVLVMVGIFVMRCNVVLGGEFIPLI